MMNLEFGYLKDYISVQLVPNQILSKCIIASVKIEDLVIELSEHRTLGRQDQGRIKTF